MPNYNKLRIPRLSPAREAEMNLQGCRAPGARSETIFVSFEEVHAHFKKKLNFYDNLNASERAMMAIFGEVAKAMHYDLYKLIKTYPDPWHLASPELRARASNIDDFL